MADLVSGVRLQNRPSAPLSTENTANLLGVHIFRVEVLVLLVQLALRVGLELLIQHLDGHISVTSRLRHLLLSSLLLLLLSLRSLLLLSCLLRLLRCLLLRCLLLWGLLLLLLACKLLRAL